MKRSKLALYLIPPLFLALVAVGALFWQWQSAGRRGLPEVSVTLEDSALLQHGGSWEVPLLGGLLTRRLEGDYPALGLTIPVDGAQPSLAVSPKDASLTRVLLTEQGGGAVLYDGDAAGFSAFSFAEDGDYYLEVWTALDRGGQGAGEFYFDAALEVALPRPDPSFTLSASDLLQGDLIAVTAENLPDGVRFWFTLELAQLDEPEEELGP